MSDVIVFGRASSCHSGTPSQPTSPVTFHRPWIFWRCRGSTGLHGNKIITSLLSSCCRQAGVWPSAAAAQQWLHTLITPHTHTHCCACQKASSWTLPTRSAWPYVQTLQGFDVRWLLPFRILVVIMCSRVCVFKGQSATCLKHPVWVCLSHRPAVRF